MKKFVLAAALICAPVAASATPSLSGIVDGHILPRFAELASASQRLSDAAMDDCDPTSPVLRSAYGNAFDAWIAASHLRFGPTEVGDRAFALAFWPDSRGVTPRTLATLIADEDPVATSSATYADVSIAARGFYALEFLLYDDTLMQARDSAYYCTLVQTVAADIAATSGAIHDDWAGGYADVLLSPGPDAPYRTEQEVLQEMLKALTAGLQFTQDSRLGRPLGTFERPRPKRAEAWRSGRSAAHVALSLASLQDLASRLAVSDPALGDMLDDQFETAQTKLAGLNDPVFASVADPQSRLKVEVVSTSIGTIRTTVQTLLGPTLGVAAGFNALDGD